jgi:hypothetical protein
MIDYDGCAQLCIMTDHALSVLMAILPFITRYSEELALQITVPIGTNQVVRFVCSPNTNEIGGYVTLKNGSEFWFEHGIVSGYRTQKSFYDLQDPDRVHEFFGTVQFGREEVITKARYSLRALGYDLRQIFADQGPEVDMPPEVGTNVVSYYQIRWIDPLDGVPTVEIGLSGVDGAIQKMMGSYNCDISPFAALQIQAGDPSSAASWAAVSDHRRPSCQFWRNKMIVKVENCHNSRTDPFKG